MTAAVELTLNERFDRAIKAVGVKPAHVAKQMDTEPVKLYNIINGKTKPSAQTLVDLVSLYPQINTEYIIKGQGPVLLNGEVEFIGRAIQSVPAVDCVRVPFVPVSGYATFIEQFAQDCKSPLKATFALLNRSANSVKDCIVMEVRGNSMSPQINDGAKVLGRCVEKADWEYQSGGVYAVLFREQFVIKRILENDLLTKGSLTLHSDNRLGGTVTVKADDIRGMWKVVETLENPVE